MSQDFRETLRTSQLIVINTRQKSNGKGSGPACRTVRGKDLSGMV